MKKHIVLIISEGPVNVTLSSIHGIESFINEEITVNLGESDSWKVEKSVPQYFPEGFITRAVVSGKGSTAKEAIVDWLKNLVCAFKFDAHPKPQ